MHPESCDTEAIRSDLGYDFAHVSLFNGMRLDDTQGAVLKGYGHLRMLSTLEEENGILN